VSRASRWSPFFAAFVTVVTAVFLAYEAAPDTYLFTHALTPSRMLVIAAVAKLTPQLLGSTFAVLCALRYGEGNPARRAWLLMGAWLAFWFVGQAILAVYEDVLAVPVPLPSLGDLFFTLGSILGILALFSFVAAYRRSGFAAGSARQDRAIALASCLVFGVVAYVFLLPVALGPTTIADRLVNVGYPLLDLVAIIPALVLLRITSAFRGGRVWRVWAALLLGIFCAMGGDVAFSIFFSQHLAALRPLVDLLYILGYGFCGYGMRLQYELVAD
jgi:hypothetical protein